MSSKHAYQCYICAMEDDDYDYFVTMSIDWNNELVCVGCEDQYVRHEETMEEYKEG